MADKVAKIGKYRLTAIADVPDFRDWAFSPSLKRLKTKLDPPARLSALNQGEEGSCTGFALASVINLLRSRGRRRGPVSPRMLYEMAKRHDEWRGFRYEGSSCRGAIKGWYNMGVCLDKTWPYQAGKPGFLTVAAAKEARKNTLGAYYRLGTRISDFHAALNEAGVIYCSAEIHSGWENPARRTHIISQQDDTEGGHAFAIVGYNQKGFWVQNSWGSRWGNNGTALWRYEDWQQNLTDAWVLGLALPTPQVWHLPREGGSDAARVEGFIRKSPTRAEIAGHFVHIDDGEFHDHGRYWSNADDVEQTASLVANSEKYDHLLLYAHGGLNNVSASARRIAAMKETFKDNRIYPYHFMYDTGLLEELKDILRGRFNELQTRAGGLNEWMDRLLEKVSRSAGRALWREMKAGAERPFLASGAGTAVLQTFLRSISKSGSKIQIHLAGHSTGAVLQAHLLHGLQSLDPERRIKSVSLLAPAVTAKLFRSHYRPLLKARKPAPGIDKMDIYALSDKLEREDDTAGLYRKSILYLVSRAFEESPLPAPLIGMAIYNASLGSRLPNLKVQTSEGRGAGRKATQSRSHAEFDNDPATMNSVLKRIVGKKPRTPFSAKSLSY